MDFLVAYSDLLGVMLTSVVDILLVSFLIYRVILLIRGTRAQQVLMGLGIIAFGFVLSRALKLGTLSWLLENFIGSFLLIVIVLFQNDIRRGLSRMGRRPLGGFAGSSESVGVINEIVRGADAMAKERIGALILIERGADLSEVANKGFQIDSRVSAPLLIQLFTPPGPTHDGAIIIQGGRLTAAAVFLQLTHNPRIDNTIGTRHRAAMGATEDFDAVAVVVSEERGQISFVEGGNLTRDLEPEMLRKVLQKYLGAPSDEKKTRNLGRDGTKAQTGTSLNVES
jgi:uncharacterized protein (TIGR00159 family)